uniref:Uncharacterized protein n=1 Tax=Oryza meridionalis TaxID=40149 RepID=A0A0E0C6U8_9ORYZ
MQPCTEPTQFPIATTTSQATWTTTSSATSSGHYLRNARQAPVVAHEDGLLVRCFPSLHPPRFSTLCPCPTSRHRNNGCSTPPLIPSSMNGSGLQGYSTEDGVAMDSDQHGRDGSDNGWWLCKSIHVLTALAHQRTPVQLLLFVCQNELNAPVALVDSGKHNSDFSVSPKRTRNGAHHAMIHTRSDVDVTQ